MGDVPLTDLMVKRISFAWELMFTRSLFEVDLEYQGFILNSGAKMVDSGAIKMPELQVLPFDLDSLKAAHTQAARFMLTSLQTTTEGLDLIPTQVIYDAVQGVQL